MQPPSNIIYLASKSPRRRELLKQIGVHYELLMTRDHAPRIDVDEPLDRPRMSTCSVVKLKAESALRVMRQRRLRPVLTADTTVRW
jgi:septum formation protein